MNKWWPAAFSPCSLIETFAIAFYACITMSRLQRDAQLRELWEAVSNAETGEVGSLLLC